MVECPKCKKRTGIVRWTEMIKDKKTGEVSSVSVFAEYNQGTGHVNIAKVEDLISAKKYWISSRDPEHFSKQEMKVRIGANCIKCNARL